MIYRYWFESMEIVNSLEQLLRNISQAKGQYLDDRIHQDAKSKY